MTLKNNRAPLLSNIKLSASFHHHMWIQTGVTVRKRLSWVLTSVTLTFDLWPWPFAWTLLWSLVITPENFMMIRWWKHSEKGGTDGQTDDTICRAAWSQLKTYRLKTFADLRRRWRSCVTRIGHTAAADVPVDSCIQLSHLYASVPPVSFWCSWISWSSRNFRQRSWLHCGSYWTWQRPRSARTFPGRFRRCYTSSMGDTCRVWLFDGYLCSNVNIGTSLDEEVIFHRVMYEFQLVDARISHAWINQDARDSEKMPESE